MDIFKDDLLKKLAFFHSKGFIECAGDVKTRACPPTANTHIGRTVEALCEVEMNNNQTPDYRGIELKSHNTISKSLITLFASNPHFFKKEKWVSRVTNEAFYEWYGRVCTTRELKNNTVRYQAPNAQGLYLDISEDRNFIELCDEYGEPCLSWSVSTLKEKLSTKFKEGVFIYCDIRHNQDGKEKFWMKEVTHVEYISKSILESIQNSYISVDILFKHKKHLRQTSFRSFRKDLINVFDTFDHYDLSQIAFE